MNRMHIANPKTDDEFGRQRALDNMQILDTPKEVEFERITSLVKSIFGTPIVAVTLIDKDRQWFKSVQGLDIAETTRDISFCDHTIREDKCLKVEDATRDPRFAQNPLVTGELGIRSYLGAPLATEDGYMLGALCVLDFKPRTFTVEQEAMLRNFAAIVMSELELRRTASIDDLTRLSNRRVFTDALHHAIEVSRTASGSEKASMILLDLDHFKSINDTYGHQAGDLVLQQVAKVLKDNTSINSVPCRIGGEEFAIVLTHEAHVTPESLAETIRTKLHDIRLADFPQLRIAASFGLAFYDGVQSTSEWREKADEALYLAKEQGRDRVVLA